MCVSIQCIIHLKESKLSYRLEQDTDCEVLMYHRALGLLYYKEGLCPFF